MRSKRCNTPADSQDHAPDQFSDYNALPAGQSQPYKRLRKEEGPSSGSAALSSPCAQDQAEASKEAITAHLRPAAALAVSQESGQFSPSAQETENLRLADPGQQNGPPGQSALPIAAPGQSHRRDLQAAVLAQNTSVEGTAVRGPAEPSLADRLNPNNAAFDPVFAAEHRARRAQEPRYQHLRACRQESKLLKRIHWTQKSAFTAEEHGYLLDLQGEPAFPTDFM